MRYKKNTIYKSIFKPLLDYIIAILLLALFSPLFLIIIILNLVLNNGQIFFTQKRPGKNEKIFTILKFQTMTKINDESGSSLSDSLRITRFGRLLRSSSLDELPQLFNVLKGDISLIGPRPLLQDYLLLYSEEQKKRHLVKPGITGWAQVNGRNAISWKEKFQFDSYYAEHISFKLDIKILFMTIIKVIRAEGISQIGHPTMEKFNGN